MQVNWKNPGFGVVLQNYPVVRFGYAFNGLANFGTV